MKREVNIANLCSQEYETNPLPMGFDIRINLYSTHGDFDYIGLNGSTLFLRVFRA